jgi:tripartite ATP-independent transporter DctM subunit
MDNKRHDSAVLSVSSGERGRLCVQKYLPDQEYEMTGIIMFFAALVLLVVGYPVAFTFGAVALFFGVIAAFVELSPNLDFVLVAEEFFSMFSMMPFRIYSIMNNTILMAVPLFILMGIILQKSALAERLLESMGILFGKVRGGLAISTVLVGTLLAASTGVVGASVVAMGVISLPVMLKYGYSKRLATGTICAAGTLGQIIPPSIVLIILGDVFQLPVGDLFKAALGPGLMLVGCYILYIVIIALIDKKVAPEIIVAEEDRKGSILKALKAIIPPLTLIVLVLGSIFVGIATPTESAAVGALGAMILAAMYRKLSWQIVIDSSQQTVMITAMVFAILIGATAFSMVFVYTGADLIVEDFMTGLPGEKWGFLILAMGAIMLLGFFIDFIEISYIVVPILLPIVYTIGLDPMWFAILIAMNLQTSFLTPPFGFSLFYLKGVSPPEVRTLDIYRGVIPFIIIQILVLASIVVFPHFYGFSG